MAKAYSVKNITGGSMKNPAKPIILMTTSAKGAVGQGHVVVSTDDVPVHLSAAQYDSCKGAIDKYVKANMLVLSVLEGKCDDKPDEEEKVPKESASEVKEKLEAYAKEAHGVDLDKRKGVDTLKAEVAALDKAAEGKKED